jgi:hypothetical protein
LCECQGWSSNELILMHIHICPCSNRRIHCWVKIIPSLTNSQQSTFARSWLQVIPAHMVAFQFLDVLQRKSFHLWYVCIVAHACVAHLSFHYFLVHVGFEQHISLVHHATYLQLVV